MYIILAKVGREKELLISMHSTIIYWIPNIGI